MSKEKLFDNTFLNDIDFEYFPKFSKTYRLSGFSDAQVRQFFSKELITYFEVQELYNIESLGSELLIYKEGNVASEQEIRKMIAYVQGLVQLVKK